MQKLAQIPALKILRVKSISTNFGSEKTPNSKAFDSICTQILEKYYSLRELFKMTIFFGEGGKKKQCFGLSF